LEGSNATDFNTVGKCFKKKELNWLTKMEGGEWGVFGLIARHCLHPMWECNVQPNEYCTHFEINHEQYELEARSPGDKYTCFHTETDSGAGYRRIMAVMIKPMNKLYFVTKAISGEDMDLCLILAPH
jgi:hypothetical protein